MWWIPVTLVGGYIVKKIFETDVEPSASHDYSMSQLERNLQRLEQRLQCTSGKKIAILGQPGAGKSSLLKKLTYGNSIPVPIVGQHTDTTQWHKEHDINFFIRHESFIFVDSPGYDTHNHPVKSYIDYFPFYQFDMIIFVVNNKIHNSDRLIFKSVYDVFDKKSICIVRSFSEDSDNKNEIIKDIERLFNIQNVNIFFSSSRTGKGISKIRSFITS